MSAENCQICGQTKDLNVAGHCQGHAEEAGGPWAAPSQTSQPSQPVQPAKPAPAAGLSLKEQLDAIPTPAKVTNPAPGLLAGGTTARVTGQNMLPGGGAATNVPGGGPRVSTTRAPQMDPYAAAQDPSVTPSGAQPAQPAGEVPQWMRNFQSHQSTIMHTGNEQGAQSSGFGGSTPSATPSYNSSNSGFEPPAQSSSYTVMIGVVIVICIIMFAYMMINKPPATTPTQAVPSGTTPTPTPAATPAATPSALPGATNPTVYPGANGQIAPATTPTTYPPAISPNPVPGPQTTVYPPSISPNPVPGSPNPGAVSPNPVPGTATNATAPNPVPGTTTP